MTSMTRIAATMTPPPMAKLRPSKEAAASRESFPTSDFSGVAVLDMGVTVESGAVRLVVGSLTI